MKGKKFTIEACKYDPTCEGCVNGLCRYDMTPEQKIAKDKEELLELDYKRHACFCTLEILDEMEKAEA